MSESVAGSPVSKPVVTSEEAGGSRQPSLARRVFLTLAVTATILAVLVLAVATYVYQSKVIEDAGNSLEDEARIMASILSDGSEDYAPLSNIDLGDVRLTVIGADGTVLYDNRTDPDSLPNHADRPEVEEAARDGVGSSERESATAGSVSIYRAVRLSDGRIVRVSVDRESSAAAIANDVGLVIGVAAVLVAASWAASRLLARRLMRPVVEIDPADPDPSSSYRELRPMLAQISAQQATLSEQVEQLRGADRMRREFTANVTHELKTPLASISGASELIRDGIAKPEDVREFAGRIYDEARHMTELVNDILILSRLDESERSQDSGLLGRSEPVDLYRVLLDAVRRLESAAEEAHVTISCDGEPVLVRGVPRLLDELAHNLCDNAIRYNREGGSVSAWAGLEGGRAVLRVSDTGVGIAPEAQRKVFERFYRVDASRARQTGGTGLGLAIVKHAATYHGAELSLESEVGKGTTITVRFPADILVDDSDLG